MPIHPEIELFVSLSLSRDRDDDFEIQYKRHTEIYQL